MSADFICRVFITDAAVAPEDVMRVLADVAQAMSFHGGAWHYSMSPAEKHAAIGALVTFARSLDGRGHYADRLARDFRRALRRLVGRDAMIDLAVMLDPANDAWRDGKATHLSIVSKENCP